MILCIANISFFAVKFKGAVTVEGRKQPVCDEFVSLTSDLKLYPGCIAYYYFYVENITLTRKRCASILDIFAQVSLLLKY